MKLTVHTLWLALLGLGVRASVEVFDYDQASYNVYDVVSLRCKPGQACYPSDSDISDLDSTLDGRVILTDSAQYKNESHMYNTLVQAYPDIIVMVQSKDDIQKTILFARGHNLHVTIRSSGHDYAGRSTWNGSLNINLSEMKYHEIDLNSVRHPDGELKVQTGLTWEEIYKLLDHDRRCIVGGSAHTVKPGGYTLGGGHSPISRSHGYAVDNLLEVQAVLADGSVATCNETVTVIEYVNGTSETLQDGDLFWAQRGGGGGTYGVVVYFVYKLHRMPDQMVTFSTWIPLKYVTWNLDISNNVFTILNNLILNLPREWGGYYLINNNNVTLPPSDTGLGYDLDLTGSLRLWMNKFAPWDGSEETVFDDVIQLCNQYSIQFSFSNKTSFWDYEKDASDPEIARVYLVGTMLQPEKVNDELVAMYRKELFQTFTNGIYFGCTGIMVGGRTTEFADDSSPLNPGYRTAISCLTCGVVLNDPYLPLAEQSKWDHILIPMADKFNIRLKKFGTGMYFNEPTKNNPTWQEDFWGSTNYDRLLEIKVRYDPENFFTCHHCVGSAKDAPSSAHSFRVGGTRVICIILTLVVYVGSKC